MKLDGIWSCELGSAYGWESIEEEEITIRLVHTM